MEIIPKWVHAKLQPFQAGKYKKGGLDIYSLTSDADFLASITTKLYWSKIQLAALKKQCPANGNPRPSAISSFSLW